MFAKIAMNRIASEVSVQISNDFKLMLNLESIEKNNRRKRKLRRNSHNNKKHETAKTCSNFVIFSQKLKNYK